MSEHSSRTLLAVCALLLASWAPAPAALADAVVAGDGSRPGWTWYVGFGLFAALAAAGAWSVQQRRLALEGEYSRRLEAAVRSRTRELADRNAELRLANEKLLEASLTDPLTGLRNRRFLFEEVGKHVELIRRWHEEQGEHSEQALNIVFLIIDLDHFKPVNDRCGHPAGDQILIQVRDVLLALCRSSDFVIRWGGDEFIIVSRNAKIDQIESLAERVRGEVARRVFEIDDAQVVRTSCSIGFASYPFVAGRPDVLNWEQVLGLADSALYFAKSHRNAWAGFLGTAAPVQYDQLIHEIRRDPGAVAARGAVEIRSSPSIVLPPSEQAG